ncbi:cytochrome c [Paenibacillus doosanensis]|uniref:c-type cytochrome n=1 Tax=Paenibacillus doosanensis TaxID=1229154 RepID=UPI00217F4A13|nr:cytochrome c [Paenibacillus doosanensis]MCS7464668.1 cytochrome c [Paenibacillus doosanensis]
MNMLYKGLGWASVLLLAGAIAGCGGAAKQSGEPFGGAGKNASSAQGDQLASAPEQAQALYKQNCMSCHGNNLEGKVGPDSNLQKIGAKLTKEQITSQILNGGGGMPALSSKVKPEEAEVLAEWLAGKK